MWQPLLNTLPAPYAEAAMLWLITLTVVVTATAMVSLYLILTNRDLLLLMKKALSGLYLTICLLTISPLNSFNGLNQLDYN